MLNWMPFFAEKMVSFLFELGAAGATLLVLLTASAHPSPTCPVAQGDACEEVKFYLWTPLNPEEPQEVAAGNISASLFNNSHPTKMIIHGYASGMNLEQLADIRKEYLLQGSYNLLSPQYLDLVDSPCYLTAVINVDYVGKCIARFIRGLDVSRRPPPSGPPPEDSGLSPGYQVLDLHLIGFSLGAQTAAFAAVHLRPEYLLDRISGLDPALPFFTTSNKDRKLSPDDAVLVDVLHTNAYVQGQAARCGQVDFYLNGGMQQPGCSEEGFFERFKCDHHRAPMYFAESIRSESGFWGWSCSSISDYEMGRCPARGAAVLAGQWLDRRSEGFYVLQTRDSSPFARGAWWSTVTSTGGSTTVGADTDSASTVVSI
ncbi:pancreatic lipase-related protein 2 [Frankliniella occidentalis]|uniref:Pancreatic lipase-related protein 2 n=1 Tax=Frankliniella occidentalis TaxID=133901 RepID=A0A6J1SHU5_FRAOC|nr:pancreatic lipase-related protein 2 [Frankliniella occidentalis]XP_052131737.1 pancreatic lipase-related protein 2 [Frankliniella occidentalis]